MPHAYSSANLRPNTANAVLESGRTLLLTITTKSNHCAVDGAEGNGALLINIAFWPAFGRLPVQRDAGLRYEIWIGGRKVTVNFCRDRVKNISFQSWFSTQSPETMNVLIFGSSMSGGGLDGKAVLSELGPWILKMLHKVSRDWFQQPCNPVPPPRRFGRQDS
jgi:hypothetical protein